MPSVPGRQGQVPEQRQLTPGIGRWTWPDGTPLSQDEVNQLGLRNAGNAGNFFDDVGHALGWNPTLAGSDAPGGSLDTQAADAQRKKMQDYIAALQQQAATGDGAWRQTFAEGVQRSKDAALALGSSSPGTDYGSALRGISAAQASAQQRSVGDAQTMQAQSQLDAQEQLQRVLGGQAQADIGQASEQARIERERRLANQASIDQSGKNREATEQGIVGGISSIAKMSDGGRVPGQPKFGGDDPRNDTVTAKLTPKEIVLPLSVTQSPDAPERAAEFVRAVKAQGVQSGPPKGNFDSGGQIPGGVGEGSANDLGNAGGYWGYLIEPHIGRTVQYDAMRKMYGQGGGGTIDTSQYDQTAAQQDALASMFGGSAAGGGPSVTAPMLQKMTDQNLAAAHAASQQGAPNSVATSRVAQAGEEGAAGVARQRAREQSEGQSRYGDILGQRRGEALQMASAQQQAGWEKTLADMGLSLQQQQALRGSISAAGQSAAAFASMGKGKEYNANPDNLKSLSDNPYPDSGMSPDELSSYQPEEQGSGLKSGMAFGGVIGLAGGGEVEDDLELSSGQKVRHMSARDNSDSDLPYSGPRIEDADARRPVRHAEAPASHESAFVRAVKAAGEYAKRASTMVGMADGGEVSPVDWYTAPPDQVRPGELPPELARLAAEAAQRGPQVYAPPAGAVPTPAPQTEAERAISRDMNAPPTTAHVDAQKAQDDRAARDALGIKPGLGSAAPAPAPTPAPTPAPVPSAAAAPKATGPSLSSKADEEAKAAAKAEYEAKVAQGDAAAKAAAAEANAIESQVLERKALAAKAQQRVDAAMVRVQQAEDEVAHIDTTVDPGRFWASRSTGDKVVGILGLVLGALGAGPDGVNRAAVMLNQAVDRDLEAQKAEHELRLRKGGQRLEAARSFYSMAREATGDELAAMDVAHALAYRSIEAKGKQMLAATNNQVAAAQLQTALAGVTKGREARNDQAREKMLDRSTEIEKALISAGARTKGPLTPERQKAVDDVESATRNIRDNVAKAKAIIARSGTFELTGTDQTELKRALSLIATDSARLKDPGSTVRDAELEIAKKEIGLEGGELTLRNSTAQSLLDSFEKSIEQRRANALAVRGIQP